MESTTPIREEIWSLIKETQKNIKDLSASQKKSALKAEKEMKELRTSQKETDQQIKTFSAELSASQKETGQQIQKIGGRFNQRWGALVESLVEGKLVKIFQEKGIDITQTHTRSKVEWRKSKGHVEKREFDIIVANGTEVVAVEVKTTLTPKDVDGFLKTLQDFKKYFPRYKTETVYGAVAYLASENKADFLAEEEGLFLIRATGDSASLVNKEDFKPKPFS
ncbi:MAG: hypothetical protein OXJ52_07300 [Oligoflexia bacterium]|nr:hypothetical protein [Oligoflexia bacterium]